jgi:hypothetical protein
MKNKNITFVILVAILTLGSCKKALDMAPDGKLSFDDIFSDPVKTGAFLNSCYANIPIKGNRYYFWSRGPVVWSDEGWDTDAEAEPSLMSGRTYNGDASAAYHPAVDVSADSGNGLYWYNYWSAIRNCTLFISRIKTAAVSNEDDRSCWNAEAHVLRAYYYSELLKWYGAVLPIEREPFDFTQGFAATRRASYYDLVKFIMEDCDAALATSQLPWRITISQQGGRVTKALAEAIKSKMILFAASPLNANGLDHWEEAYQINKTSLANLKANDYELYNKVNLPQTYLTTDAYLGPNMDVHTALYNEYFTQTMTYPIDKETIYQSTASQGNVWDIDGVGAEDGYKSGTCPSQELIDSYETIDGQPILDLNNPYLDEQHTQPNYNLANTLYNPNDPYSKRDPRFYASIYYNGSKRKALWSFAEAPASVENYPAPIGYRTRVIATYVGEPQTGIDPSIRKATRTGYFERKFLHPNSGNNVVVAGAKWKLFRLGEVILDFAEAAAEAGHLSDAITAVNEIRTRAGMPNLQVGLAQDELIRRIRNERRVELAMEENRYFDIRRWTSPGGNLSKTDKWITAMEITRQSNGTFSYARRPVRTVERYNYTNKWLWLPIPLNEANRIKAITGQDWQNSGW